MNATVIAAFCLAIIGALVLLWILWAFYGALIGNSAFLGGPRGLSDKVIFKRREKLLADADGLLKTSATAEALVLLRRSFILDHIKSTERMIDSSVNLHLSILSRLIMIAERKGSHLTNLPVVEDLFQSRGQLLHSYFDTHKERGLLKQKRSESGKGVAEWALSEYDRKLNDLEDRIQTNRRSIESQVEILFENLAKIAESTHVTFH